MKVVLLLCPVLAIWNQSWRFLFRLLSGANAGVLCVSWSCLKEGYPVLAEINGREGVRFVPAILPSNIKDKEDIMEIDFGCGCTCTGRVTDKVLEWHYWF